MFSSVEMMVQNRRLINAVAPQWMIQTKSSHHSSGMRHIHTKSQKTSEPQVVDMQSSQSSSDFITKVQRG